MRKVHIVRSIVIAATTMLTLYITSKVNAQGQTREDARYRKAKSLVADLKTAQDKGDQSKIKDVLLQASRMKISLDHLLEVDLGDFAISNGHSHNTGAGFTRIYGVIRNKTNKDFQEVVLSYVSTSSVNGLQHKHEVVVRNLTAKQRRIYIGETQVQKPNHKITVASVAEGPVVIPEFKLRGSVSAIPGPITTTCSGIIDNLSKKQWDVVRVNLALFDDFGRMIHAEPLLFTDFLVDGGQRFQCDSPESKFTLSLQYSDGIPSK